MDSVIQIPREQNFLGVGSDDNRSNLTGTKIMDTSGLREPCHKPERISQGTDLLAERP